MGSWKSQSIKDGHKEGQQGGVGSGEASVAICARVLKANHIAEEETEQAAKTSTPGLGR